MISVTYHYQTLANKLDGLTKIGLKISICLWIIMAFGCVFLITLGTDEAWDLCGLRSYLEPPVPNLSSPPVTTSGGLFALANVALEYIFGSVVWIHRLFSLFCLLTLVGIVSWQANGLRRPTMVGLLSIAPLLGVPGTAEVGTTALGTSTGVMLLVLASLVWCNSTAPGTGRTILCGLLFGLSAASRFDLILFAPALLIASSIHLDDHSSPQLKVSWSAIAVVVIALGLFAANQFLMQLAAHDVFSSGIWHQILISSGIKNSYFYNYTFINYTKILNHLLVGMGFAQPGLLVLASVAGFWRFHSDTPPAPNAQGRFAILMLALAWIFWLAWLLRAPVPHLRYLWPSLVCFAILCGNGLSMLYGWSVRANQSLVALSCQVIALGLVLGGLGGTFRSLVHGERDYQDFEWARQMETDYFRRFQHVQDERAAVTYLKNDIPQDATVAAISVFVYPLRYLAHRPIVSIPMGMGEPIPSTQPDHQKTFLVLSPQIGTFLYFHPEAFTWIETHARLKTQFGRYSFYELPDGLPKDTNLFDLPRTIYERHPQSRYWFGRRQRSKSSTPPASRSTAAPDAPSSTGSGRTQ